MYNAKIFYELYINLRKIPLIDRLRDLKSFFIKLNDRLGLESNC